MNDRELERFLEDFHKEQAQLAVEEAPPKKKRQRKHSHRYDTPGIDSEGTHWKCDCGQRMIAWNYDGRFRGFHPLTDRNWWR